MAGSRESRETNGVRCFFSRTLQEVERLEKLLASVDFFLKFLFLFFSERGRK